MPDIPNITDEQDLLEVFYTALNYTCLLELLLIGDVLESTYNARPMNLIFSNPTSQDHLENAICTTGFKVLESRDRNPQRGWT